MNKFTKGPWSVEHDKANDIFWVESPETSTQGICDLYHITGSGIYKEIFRKQDALANAHLIAAAPEMYEALECCLNELECLKDLGNSLGTYAIKKAKEALKKARGSQDG